MFSAPTWDGDQQTVFFFDTDQATTGCDDTTGHTGDGTNGYEYRLRIDTTGADVSSCNTGTSTWNGWSGISTTDDAASTFLEFSIPYASIGLTGCGDGFDFFVFHNGGTDDPDDQSPNEGTDTLIELAAFAATAQGQAVTLTWQTLSEIDNAGFNLYRRAAHESDWSLLTDALVPAAGGPTFGADYSYLDESVLPGLTYYYMLEDVEFDGTTTRHDETAWVTVPFSGDGNRVGAFN